MPPDALAAPGLLAPKSIKDREQKGDGGGETHQRVHVGGGMEQLTPGCAVEGPPADNDIG